MNTTSELRTRLRAKLQRKKDQRASKEQAKLQEQKHVEQIVEKQVDSNEDARIIYDVRNLMIDVSKLKRMNPVHKAKKLSPKYEWLHKTYFQIYRATVFGEMKLDMLAMMLRQRRQIGTTQEGLEKASQHVGAVLAKTYNVDLAKLEKDMKDKYGAGVEAEKQ